MQLVDSNVEERARAMPSYPHGSALPSGASGSGSTGAYAGAHTAAAPQPENMRRYENGQPVWRVPCGDMIGRERCVTVFVDKNEVVLVGPPGETARLSGNQLGQLKTALNEAAKQAER